jgi:hypothetical protein
MRHTNGRLFKIPMHACTPLDFRPRREWRSFFSLFFFSSLPLAAGVVERGDGRLERA